MRSPTHSTVCALSSASRCSKSKIMVRTLLSSPVAVRPIQEPGHVMRDGVVERRERCREPGAPQVPDPGLGEILIAVAYFRRHLDILDLGFSSQRREHRDHHGTEARVYRDPAGNT